MFNPLIQSTNQSYQALSTQMGRMSYFFAPPQLVYQLIPQIQNISQIQNPQPFQVVNLWFRGNNMCLNPNLLNQ